MPKLFRRSPNVVVSYCAGTSQGRGGTGQGTQGDCGVETTPRSIPLSSIGKLDRYQSFVAALSRTPRGGTPCRIICGRAQIFVALKTKDVRQ